ncbi:MAG: HAD-IA family hydrolase [Hyphomicrobiaceae bacterium]
MIGIVFDLDGTLVESAPAICKIANAFMAERGLRPLDLAETRAYVGNGAATFLERALKARSAFDMEAFPAQCERFLAHYAAAPPEDNLPMPGSVAALAQLAATGHRLALCTNKPTEPTMAIVEALGWSDLIRVVVAGDTLPYRKPHPAPLLKAAKDLDTPTVFSIGDSEVDCACAMAAGLPFVLYTGGYLNGDLAAEPVGRFADFAGLPSLINRLAA